MNSLSLARLVGSEQRWHYRALTHSSESTLAELQAVLGAPSKLRRQIPAGLFQKVAVRHRHLHFVFRLVQPIGKCSCCGFINYPQHVQASDLPSIFGSLRRKGESADCWEKLNAISEPQNLPDPWVPVSENRWSKQGLWSRRSLLRVPGNFLEEKGDKIEVTLIRTPSFHSQNHRMGGKGP